MGVTGKLLEFLLDLAFPRACPMCDRPVPVGEGRICVECRRKIVYIREPVCLKCGKKLVDEAQIMCSECEQRPHQYEQGMALYDYQSVVSAIFRYKYKNRRDYGKFFGEDLARHFGEQIRAWKIDAIIPVPLSAKREKERGYNQAKIIAKSLGESLDIPVYCDYIRRIRHTKPLKKMDYITRQNNLKNAFLIPEDDVKLKRVLLVDDIYTTGSTIDAISEELKMHGVRGVYFVTLSIGEGL